MTENQGQGALYLVATPIGNLEDITLRALRVLKEVDLVAAEDTRQTRKLLAHFDVHTDTISYHAHNEHRKTENLLDMVEQGRKIALVTDAGTPAIADPGFLIVREAVARGLEPVVVPGVSSLTFAAVAAGLPVDKFSFYGFLPVKPGKKSKLLELIGERGETAVVFESPYRIEKALKAIAETLGKDTAVAVVREATKLHEEILRGTAGELSAATAGRKWKGEIVIVISPQA